MNARCNLGFLAAGMAVLLLADMVWCQPAAEVVERTTRGVIDWSRGLVLAEGVVAPQRPLSPAAEEKQSAIAEARRLAGQRLFETVMQVRIQGGRYVGDLVAGNPIISAKIREMVENARLAGQEYLSDGTVSVTVGMSLHGGFAQLVLPPEIKQVQPLKKIGHPNGGNSSSPAVDNPPPDRKPPYTGLVIDARGSGCLPAIFPTVWDETGEEIFGAAYVSREYAVQRGMSVYATDLDAAMTDPRVSPRPMTVKGLRFMENDPSAIVISNADGARVRGTPEHLSFFRTCNIVIVLDPPGEVLALRVSRHPFPVPRSPFPVAVQVLTARHSTPVSRTP